MLHPTTNKDKKTPEQKNIIKHNKTKMPLRNIRLGKHRVAKVDLRNHSFGHSEQSVAGTAFDMIRHDFALEYKQNQTKTIKNKHIQTTENAIICQYGSKLHTIMSHNIPTSFIIFQARTSASPLSTGLFPESTPNLLRDRH